MKYFALFSLLLIGQCFQVIESDKCKECNQFKSQIDCLNEQSQIECEWINNSNGSNGKCQKKANQQNLIVEYKSYCGLVNQSEKNCRLTNGCAYLNKKCQVFGGCTSYEYSQTQVCQEISYQCISNGKQCIQAGNCQDYTEDKCEIFPSLSGIRICQWDTIKKICRDYKCSESEDKLTTDIQCDQWLKGCITRGLGCWDSPLPMCSSYRGDENKCSKYFGSDGYCELGIDEVCQAKKCEKAPSSYNNDSDCKKYQKGCITNGKGCIQGKTRPLCSTYMGDIYTCKGYIGSDGNCEGQFNGINCRAKRCIDSPKYNTDDLCRKYQSNCKTNGIQCVENLELCSSYEGNYKICLAYIGKDGYCKGSEKEKESHQQCTVRVCNEAPVNLNTDDDCNKYQKGCVTTGFGCINKEDIKSCSSYEGDSEKCLKLVGKEGQCMWLSGKQCTVRECESAPIQYNQKCSDWLPSCISTGNSCINIKECQYTINQTSCEETKGCFWQSTCINNTDCSYFPNESICTFTQAKRFFDGVLKTIKCIWSQNVCRELHCEDLIGNRYKEDVNCLNQISSCISDQKSQCITRYDCQKLTGNQKTCLNYQGYCTNVQSAEDDTPCIIRQCKDNIDYTTNEECNNFLPGCVTNGRGCVDYQTQCSQMQGTQSTCNQLYGQLSGNNLELTIIQCYNHKYANSTDYCQIKTCNMADNIENDDQCQAFLKSCVYNGNGGCINPLEATCESYYGDELFCENAIVLNQNKQCVGTSIKGQCVKRECWQKAVAYTDQECEQFRSGCLLLDSSCVDQSTRSCQDQLGNEATCLTRFGGMKQSNQWKKIQCLKKVFCQERQCQDISNPDDPEDCSRYKSTCRFFKQGYPCIQAQLCDNYLIPDNIITDQLKFYYCANIKDFNGLNCGWNQGQYCSIRSCNQTQFGLSVDCTNFIQKGKTTGHETCKLSGSICYALRADCLYPITSYHINDQLKYKYCISLQNDKGINCSYIFGDSTCSQQDTCEKIINTLDAKTCNDFLNQNGQCQKGKNSHCYTTTNNCFNYQLPPLYTYSQKLDVCESLKVIDETADQPNIAYKSCTYIDGLTCSNITQCSDIIYASSQKDCDTLLAGCLYFEGQCYSKVSQCYDILFPSGVKSETMKSLFCNSMKDVNQQFCSLNYEKSGCEINTKTDCNQIISIPPNWDYQLTDINKFCLAHTDNTKTIQCINDNGFQCKAGSCEDIPSPLSQNDCDNHIYGCIFFMGKCIKSGKLMNHVDCSDVSKVPFTQEIMNLTAKQKNQYCELFQSSDINIQCFYDQFDDTKNNCSFFLLRCQDYQIPADIVDKNLFCQSRKNEYGYSCKQQNNNCVDKNCLDALDPKSQLDCDSQIFSKKCKYLQGTCYNFEETCSQIPALKQNSKQYCESLIIQNKQCTYKGGDFCVEVSKCEFYDVSIEVDRVGICNQLSDESNNKCAYLWGNYCVGLSYCQDYDGSIDALKGPQLGQEHTQCFSVKSIQDKRCVKDENYNKKCRDQVCQDILEMSICVNENQECFYYKQKCLQKMQCHQYQPIGDNDEQKQQWCEGVNSIDGTYCKWNGFECSNRSCLDVQHYTDNDCQKYLARCKTDGMKCIDKNQSCNSIKVVQSQCGQILDQNGKDKCKSDELSSNVSRCDNRTCYDNISAQTDTQCNEFMRGCVTRGFGCIPNTEPCSSYRGTKKECEQFKQLINNEYVYCSGDEFNQSNSECKIRSCSDNKIATSNEECQQYLKGCLTKGLGCIEESALCSEYQGNQIICSRFRGNFDRDLCYNFPQAGINANCLKKECSYINGVDNQTCNEGFDTLTCVFDGYGCIKYGKNCSEYQGNLTTCSQFIAIDGPCKATIQDDNMIRNCKQRICSEAPNTFQSDIDCQLYHPSCYTNGYGCTSIKQCDLLIKQSACLERTECSWTHFCNNQFERCDQIQDASHSICSNSKVSLQQCVYAEDIKICRPQNCEDLPHYITSHSLCNQLNQNCTTSGRGCISQGLCSSYKTSFICFNAYGQQKCIWDQVNNICRDIKCFDFSGRTDAECEQKLSGCITDGTNCIYGESCIEYKNQNYCIYSKTGPCLWVSNQCINYSKCDDAKLTTFEDCQLISISCTTNRQNCIPITYCSQYQNYESCIFGLDGLCGWNEKCQKFQSCSDMKSVDTETCRIFHNDCVSDGSLCIKQAKSCPLYLSSIACANPSLEGLCIWDSKAQNCKLKQCEDSTYDTHSQCQNVSNLCTTDGKKCIKLSQCKSYLELSCHYGTDGECIFSYPISGNSTIKSCRAKECQDIYFSQDNQTCQKAIPGKRCVSNGSYCIPQAPCDTYKTLTACQGGGFDGQNSSTCVFLPIKKHSQIGTCKVFLSCIEAEEDQLTCQTNLSCYWNSSQNKCVDQTCQTFSFGFNCNPIPSFDGTKYTICIFENGKCQTLDPKTISDSQTCYVASAYTHTWNTLTNQCETCSNGSTPDQPRQDSFATSISVFILASLVF